MNEWKKEVMIKYIKKNVIKWTMNECLIDHISIDWLIDWLIDDLKEWP